MYFMSLLQNTTPFLSGLLLALCVDVLTRLAPVMRDYLPPLFGIPARMAQRLESKLNRSTRDLKTRAGRGGTTLVLMLGLGLVLAAGSTALIKYYPMTEALLWFTMLRVTFAWIAGYELSRALQKNDLTAAAQIMTRRHVEPLTVLRKNDRPTLLREILENSAVSLSSGFWLPVFYALLAALLGVPATPVAVLVVTLSEACRVIITPDKHAQAFVRPFLVIEQVLAFVPARIAALFIVLAALFTPRANPLRALNGMFAHGPFHRHPNLGWPMAAFGCALGVALPSGNPPHAWLGSDKVTARLDVADLKHGIWLHAAALGLSALSLIALLFISLAI